MLGNDCDEVKYIVLKAFYSRTEEEEWESNIEISKLLVLTNRRAEEVDSMLDHSTAK